MGPNGTQSRCVKSLRDGRWNFTVLRFSRSKAFYASRLSPKRRFRKTQKWFRIHFFTTCTAMSVKIGTLFHTLRPKWKLYTFSKQKNVAFRVNFRAKVKNNSFWLILSRKKAFEMKSVFCWYQLRNLAQTNAFYYIPFNVNLAAQTGISHVHF